MSNEFLTRWRSLGDDHFKAAPTDQEKFNLGSAAYDFLFISGMPSEFQDLNFDCLKDARLQTVNEMWNLENIEFDKYLAIGFNGSGDPIALDQESQQLVYLNHDNNHQEVFINTDLRTFAFTILRLQEFVDQMKKLTPDSFYETEFSDENFEHLKTDLKGIDDTIFKTDLSHWVSTLENLKWERDDERAN